MRNKAPLEFDPHYAGHGLVPTHFDGRWILERYPYETPAERLVAQNQTGDQFPEDVFRNATSHPFEIWRMLVRLTGVDDAEPPYIYDPQPTTLNKHVRLRVQDVSHERLMTKNVALVDLLLMDNTLTWEWYVPYTLDQSEGILVESNTTILPEYCVPDLTVAQPDCTEDIVQIAQVRVEVAFQGYMLLLGPEAPPNA